MQEVSDFKHGCLQGKKQARRLSVKRPLGFCSFIYVLHLGSNAVFMAVQRPLLQGVMRHPASCLEQQSLSLM